MPLMNWVPKFIRRVFAYQPRHVVTAQEYNNDFNMLVEQGDHNAEALVDLRSTVQSGNIVLGPESSINWGNIYGVPSMWPGDLSWDKILEAIETTYIDANGVWTPNVYAQNISTLYAKIRAAQIEDLEVGRNVFMGPNAAITWSQVTDPPGSFSEATIKEWIDANQISSAEIQALIEQYGMSETDVATFISTMISNGEIATSQDLQDLAFQWADDVLALITATYIDANGVWTPRVYTQNLVAGTALIGDALIENIDADKITGDIGRFGSVTINNLTTQKGYIAELTTDRHDTSDMVYRYNLQPGDPDYALRKAPVKYQRMNDEVRERVVATYAGDLEGGVENRVQCVNRAGDLLYYLDATKTGITEDATDWPVWRFVYDGVDGLGLVKEREYFDTDGTNYIPAKRHGLGNGVGDNGTMTEAKWTDGYRQKYIATGGGSLPAGTEVSLGLTDDGIVLNGVVGAPALMYKIANDSAVSIDTAETTVCSMSIVLTNVSKFQIAFSSCVESAAALSLTVKCYINGVAHPFQPEQNIASAGNHIVSFTIGKEVQPIGTVTIAVKMATSASTASVAASQGTMVVQAFPDVMPELNDATGFTATAASTTQIDLAWVAPT